MGQRWNIKSFEVIAAYESKMTKKWLEFIKLNQLPALIASQWEIHLKHEINAHLGVLKRPKVKVCSITCAFITKALSMIADEEALIDISIDSSLTGAIY